MNLGLKSATRSRKVATVWSLAKKIYGLEVLCKSTKKQPLITNLGEILAEDSSAKLGDRIEAKWKEEEESARKAERDPSLRRILINMFGGRILIFGIFVVIEEILVKMGQTLFAAQIITYFLPNKNSISRAEACSCAMGMVGCSLISAFVMPIVTAGLINLGMRMRVACCALIYRKAMRLSTLGKPTIGHVATMVSIDVHRFDTCLTFVPYLAIAPIQCALAIYFLLEEVGVSVFVGVLCLLCLLLLQLCTIKLVARYYSRTAQRTSERISLMTEMIIGIQSIKMYAWEKSFAKLMASFRRLEMDAFRMVSFGRDFVTSLALLTSRFSIFLTIIVYLLLGNDFDSKKLFVLFTFYNLVRTSVTIRFPHSILELEEVSVSIRRINAFLLNREVKPTWGNVKLDLGLDYAVTIRDGAAKWGQSLSVRNINLKVKRGDLVAVIGPAGSGKSSLLHVILQELPLETGSLRINGQVSYATQRPWLFPGTVRQNILFGQEMDERRYDALARIFGLEKDFNFLPCGDQTMVGARGLSLSGGQKARINLARAVYKEADIYLLDDPLSAVDTHVGKRHFQECIREYLGEKTVILVTHQLQYLNGVDHIVILEDGQIKAQGTLGQIQETCLDLAQFLRGGKVAKRGKKREKFQCLKRNSMIKYSTQFVDEHASTDHVSWSSYKAYVKAGGNWCFILMLLVLLILSQVLVSVADYFMVYWVNLQQKRNDHLDVPGNFWNFSREIFINVYAVIIVATISLAVVRAFAFASFCTSASLKLHHRMFNGILRATMQFFSVNDSGTILNGVSTDMGVVDAVLPWTLFQFLQVAANGCAVVVITAFINPLLLIPAAIVAVLSSFLRKFYLEVSRRLLRLEEIAHGPVYTHLNSSLQGLTTIRALGVGEILKNEFDNHQDIHTSAWSTLLTVSVSFGFWLDLFCAVYIALVMVCLLFAGDAQNGGYIGFVITQSLALIGVFQSGVRHWAELEHQMVSVECVKEYGANERERELESVPLEKNPSTSWPEKGEIKFVNLHLKYCPDDLPVLNHLYVTIRPSEKVGIVGRTGGGKSSLISALFQLSPIPKGTIFVDNVDITKLGLHDLRSKIAIVPQEPFLFEGTLRKNLDPFDEFPDDVLWKALGGAEMKNFVSALPFGLNSKISGRGTNLSIGQRQLICFARALLRKNKILVLDEATSNVDAQTDALIQKTVRTKFENCTVLTIAHRLNTVMDSDKVLVMDAGKIVQFNHPHVLLNDTKGIFYGMVQQAGPTMTETLIGISERNYNKRIQFKTKL